MTAPTLIPILTLLCCLATTAVAQVAERPATDSTPRALDAIVVTGSRAPTTVGGASGVVLHPDSLHLPPAASLEHGLRELPFVLARQNSRGETELSLRGSESRQVAVLVDGIPLTIGWDHRTDPSLVPLLGAQRLTLVRGLSSLLHGPNVLGGIVEVDVARGAPGIAPRPAVAIGTGIGEAGARLFSAMGSAPLAAGSGTLTLRGGVGYRTRNGLVLSDALVDPAAGRLQTNSDLEQVSGFAAARWQHPLGRYVGLTATGFRAERGVPPELHVASPRRWRYPSVSRTLAVLSGGTEPVMTPLGFGSVDLALGLHRGSTEIDQFDDPAYQTVTGHERGEERTLSGRLHGRHSLPAHGELRAALTGAEVRYDEFDGDAEPIRYRQRLWSVGMEAEWPVVGDLRVGGGLDYDGADTPETGGRPPLGALGAWGWRLGVSAPMLNNDLQLHASVSRRARFPSLRELYSDAVNRFEPNPNLRPERLLGAEVGMTLMRAWGGGVVTVQPVLFHHRLADAIVREAAGDGRFRRVNRNAVRSTGLELLTGWRSPHLSVTADLLFQRVRVDTPTGDHHAEHQPELRGRLGLEAPLVSGIELLSDLRYVGRQYCVHPDLQREVALGGNAEGDIGLAKTWRLRGGGGLLSTLRAMIGVDNVTDATVYSQCGLPRAGRTVRVGVQLR